MFGPNETCFLGSACFFDMISVGLWLGQRIGWFLMKHVSCFLLYNRFIMGFRVTGVRLEEQFVIILYSFWVLLQYSLYCF